MAHSTWHVDGSIFVYLCLCFVLFKTVNTQDGERPYLEKRPLVSMDFNIQIDAGTEDCYYQYVQPDASFYVSYQVMFR